MLKRIELKNFKCYEKLDMELGNMNLLSGINSMGKSTVIQAILLIRQAFEQECIKKGFFLNGAYTQLGTGRDILNNNAKDEEIGIKITNERQEWFQWKITNKREADYLQSSFQSNSEDSGRLEEKINILNGNFEYIIAERLGPRKSYEKSYYNAMIHNNVGIRGEYAAYYLEQHGEDVVENERVILSGRNRLKDQVNFWMNYISPGIRIEIVDFQQADLVGLQMVQEMNNADYGTTLECKPVNVGFGISYVLPVVIALIKAQKNDMVILENPEAHLHPAGQRKIGELAARAAAGGAQIIVETHSDHILNGLRLGVKNKLIGPEQAKLFYFHTKIENNITVHEFDSPKIDANGGLNSWPEGFFDEWDNALLELL